MAKNITAEPKPPRDLHSKAKKMLDVLLSGRPVSRKNCHTYGVALLNDSVHSIASVIRYKLLVPVITMRKGREVADYIIDQSEIARFFDPKLREKQKFEMLCEMEVRRKSKLLQHLEKMIASELEKESPDTNFLSELKKVITRNEKRGASRA